MNKIHLTLLLTIIKRKSNILLLRRQRLSFKQIVELTESATKEGFIHYVDDQISLTEMGQTFLNDNIELTKKRNKKDWIEIDVRNKVTPISKNEVFLPDRSEFSF